MAQYRFNILDAKNPQVLADYCAHHGYPQEIWDEQSESWITNPELPHDWAEAHLKKYFKRPYLEKKAKEAYEDTIIGEDF